MGAWDIEPWDNDTAADWYGDLFDNYPIHEKVEETLLLNVEDFHEEIRAAAYLLICLGRPYIWPITVIDAHCELAVRKLEEIQRMEIYAHQDFQQKIAQEIKILRSRIPDNKSPEKNND